MKKKILYAVLIAALFIPTVFAIASYNPKGEGLSGNPELVTEITVYDTNSTLFRITEDHKDGMSLFLSLLEGTKTTAVPDPVKAVSHFKVIYKTAEENKSYDFYFSLNPNECYYETPEGEAYLIKAAPCETFLLTEYAACVYGDIVQPVLKIGASSAVVMPNTFDWQYKLFNGSYRAAETETSAEVPTVKTANTLGIDFSDTPDYLFLKVSDRASSDVLYEGLIDSFKKVAVSQPTEIFVELTAKWYSSDARPNYGNGSYSFYTTVSPDVAFTLSSKSVTQGGALLVSARNASSASDIIFSSEPELDIKPVFYIDGDTARALIPFTYHATASEYKLTFTCGGVTVSETVTVKNAEYKEKTFTASSSVLNSTLSAANREKLSGTLSQILALPSENTYLGKPTFILGTRDESVRVPYGAYLKLSSDASLEFRHLGIDQSIAKDDWVKAVNTGKVIYVGEDPILGGMVVVDHGLGIKSWYCRVGSISVKVGDTVEQGKVIARSDFSGFGEDKRMHSMLSVGDAFISLPAACDGDIKF